MGIKNLNRFLKQECPNSINMISLKELSGKKIVIDISIYLYKFEAENALIENIYLMLSVFRYYNIIPIFIFDGKPPTEKKECIQKRMECKKKAQTEYYVLKQHIDDAVNPCQNIQEMQNKMDLLKKKFVYMHKEKIEEVKKLIRAYGATYYDAEGEADELCAILVIKKKVWACLSEDMDMFVYGCNRVLRYISLLNHTAVLYDTVSILENLGITQKELREICVISGTDYNENIPDKKQFTLYNTLKLFKTYRKQSALIPQGQICFYDWLKNTTKNIPNYDSLQKINEMFDLSLSASRQNHVSVNNLENVQIMNGIIIKEDIIKILKQHGFIFA